MPFVYSHPNADPGVVEALDFVTHLFTRGGFWQEIAAANPFTQTSSDRFTPALIAERMQACANVIEIEHYHEDSSATAVVYPRVPFTIFLNDLKFNRSVAAKANTIVHEFVHVVDMFCDGVSDTGRWNYGHSRLRNRRRPNSAPYWIGNLAEDWWHSPQRHGLLKSSERHADQSAAPLRNYADEEGLTCGSCA